MSQNDLLNLFRAHDEVARWKAENDNASARLTLARMKEHMAHLISQAEPINGMAVDRDKLRVIFGYVMHGDLTRLARDFERRSE